MSKVTMTLSEFDAANAVKLMSAVGLESKAEAVSLSLAIADMCRIAIEGGGIVVLRDKDGSEKNMRILGIN